MSDLARQLYESWRKGAAGTYPPWEATFPADRDVWELVAAVAAREIAKIPVPMLLWCPACHERHYDVGEFETRPHHTHACQHCGLTWRPARMDTVGVKFLPGFKNEAGAPRRRTQSIELETQRHAPPPVDLHHSQGIEVAAVIAGTPLSIPCPRCMVKAAQPCDRRFGPTTMGDYGPDFHEERRPTCGMVFMEGGVERTCNMPAGHDSSRHQS